MRRLEARFRSLREKGEKALIAFVTAGDPDLPGTGEIMLALERGGADVLELGIPFSDPTADGPVIQAASRRALKKGTCLKQVLSLVSEVRAVSQIPIVLFGYYNPIHAYGPARFAKEAALRGVDGVLVVDLPFEESKELRRFTDPAGIDFITLVAPTTGEERARKIVGAADGFLYYISLTGVTGTSMPAIREIEANLARLRRLSKLPVVVGFGIATPEQAAEISRHADGIVVGSAFVNLIDLHRHSSNLAAEVEAFAAELKRGLKTPWEEGRPLR